MKTSSILAILCIPMSFNAASQDFGSWSVSMGRTMTMNSAICNQTGTCGKLTDAQKAQRKAITDDAFNCMRAANKRHTRDDRAKERAVAECKTRRDRQYAALRTSDAAETSAPAGNTTSTTNAPPIDFAIANYQVSANVTNQVRARLRDGLGKVANSSAEQQLLANIDFEAVFDSAMKKHGLRSGNMIDAMTGYWLTMWSIVHRAPFPDRAAIDGTRAQMAVLATQSGIANVRSDDRQRESQKLIWQTVLAMSAQRKAGVDAAGLAAEMNKVAVSQGMDLARMAVSNEGFVAR